MSKRNESILNQLAVFPWWVILILAALSYLCLKFLLPSISPGNPISNSFLQGVSKVAPVIAIVLLIASAYSLINQLLRGKMFESQTGLDSIADLSWRQFEALVGEAFRKKGYLVLENPSEGADGGVDLRLRKSGELTLVQCKHWKSQRVGVRVVRELYGVMTARKADKGIIATFGKFTKEAIEFAKDKRIQLITGNQLLGLISEVQKSGHISAPAETNEVCPKCGSEIVIRVANKGKYSGQKFWGCSEFPRCRGIRKYEVK